MLDGQSKLIKIKGFEGRALKTSGEGVLVYSIWLDAGAAVYVRIEANALDSKAPGSHSNYAYSVGACIEGRIEGYDVGTGSRSTTKDNNVSAFVKAVVRDLMKSGSD